MNVKQNICAYVLQCRTSLPEWRYVGVKQNICAYVLQYRTSLPEWRYVGVKAQGYMTSSQWPKFPFHALWSMAGSLYTMFIR